jgi:hypothetical protein
MIDKAKARKLVAYNLQATNERHGLDLIVVDEQTIEDDFGWVFFYSSKQYIETGDFRFAIAGNAPFIVDRRDGSLHPTGTAEPIETFIDCYKKACG